ncbi:hypothetical protein QWY93_16635 [Echinicola jeungdonensis]|uniref:G-D-S-L family lipolytic protein n=1 Tax=Echinicola jeungdonensis TaxID=709343 RepID=A0ABV5J6S6_9BACT|nr:hypothetical protein [Echinicola jeungdonensis]MDN3670946.1 hypothetical protein [Echinicola jeungdonensis]
MKNKCKTFFLLTSFFFTACQYDFPELPSNEPTPGNADFSKMISVGNSITAGYMDAALYNRGQQNSFPVILADQLKLVNGGEFNIPDINSENGFYTMGPNGPLGRLILTIDPATGNATPEPIGPGDIPMAYTGEVSQLNNFGVPGITLGLALTPLTGGPNSEQNPAFNPLYARFASDPGTSTVIGDAAMALANGGTFFTFWLGANDVIGYAVGGASNPAILTSDADFQSQFTAALGTILNANSNAKGVVVNIPNINILPHFNLVPINALPLSETEANQANLSYALYNGGLAQAASNGLISQEEMQYRTITFETGQNPFVMEDESLTDLSILGLPSIRQSKESDKTVLALSQTLGMPSSQNPQGIRGLTFPVEDRFILIPDEQKEIMAKINSFNSYIEAAVNSNSDRLVMVDAAQLVEQATAGNLNAGGVSLTNSIIPPTGGISLDGIHPNGRGNAFLTNLIIENINSKWNANIPRVNPNAYVGNDLPQ